MTYFVMLFLLLVSGCQMATEPTKTDSAPGERVPIESTVQLQVAEYPLGPIEDADGNLWLGSVGSGAMMWNGEMLRYFHAEDGLVGDRVTGLTLGPEGNLWLVSADESMGGGSALMKWDGEVLMPAIHPTGFPANPIGPYFDHNGELWVQSGGQFQREVEGVFEPFFLPEPTLPRTNTSGYEPKSLLQMRNGDYWFATSDQGAYRWDGKEFHQLTMADGLPTNNVSMHMEDRHGNLWLSCFHWHLNSGERSGALCMWDGETVTTFPDVPGLTGNEIYSVFEDRNGHIWICATGHCVYRYDGSNFSAFKDTQPPNPDFRFGCNSIYEDRKGRLWFGFAGGLYRLDGETFVNVTRTGPWD